MTTCARADLWRFICVLLCFSGVIKAIRIEKFNVPQNVLETESPRLVCYHALDPEEPEKALVIKWWWIPLGNPEGRSLIYQRLAGHSPQVLREGIVVEDDDRLKLESAAPQDSGVYECEASVIEEDRRSGRLIVYAEGSGPEINATVLQDTYGQTEAVLIECGAANVAPKPELLISVNEWAYPNDTQVLGSVQEGRYTVASTVTVPYSNFSGDVRCDMRFKFRELQDIHYSTTISTDDVLKAEPSINIPDSDRETTERISRIDISQEISNAELMRPIEINKLDQFGVTKLTTVRTKGVVLVTPPSGKLRTLTLDLSEPTMAPHGTRRPYTRLDFGFKGKRPKRPNPSPDISVELIGSVAVMRPVSKDMSVEMEPGDMEAGKQFPKIKDFSMEVVEPPAIKREYSTLDIVEEIATAEALKPAVMNGAAISLKHSAVVTTLLTGLALIFL